MPDLDLIKQGEQGVRDRRGRLARAAKPSNWRSPATRRRCGYACPLALAADHQRTHLILHIDYPRDNGMSLRYQNADRGRLS